MEALRQSASEPPSPLPQPNDRSAGLLRGTKGVPVGFRPTSLVAAHRRFLLDHLRQFAQQVRGVSFEVFTFSL
jgi:hypothetical protein